MLLVVFREVTGLKNWMNGIVFLLTANLLYVLQMIPITFCIS